MNLRQILFGALLSAMALVFAFLPIAAGIRPAFTYVLRTGVYCVVCPTLMVYIIAKARPAMHQRTAILPVVFTTLLSQFTVLGEVYCLTDRFDIYNSLPISWATWLLNSAVWFTIFFPIVKRTIEWLDRPTTRLNSPSLNWRKLIFWIIAVRVVFFACFYPCIFDYDGAFGLRTMLAPGEVVSNHYPYFVQLAHAVFYRIGASLFGRPDIGMALLTLTWVAASSAIILYATRATECVAGTGAAKAVGYILALFPLFPLLSAYPTKDSFFSYSFLLYTACLLKLHVSRGECIKQWRFIALFIASMTLLCFTRNQGIYILTITSIYLLWLYRRLFCRIVIACAIPIALTFVVNICYLPAIGVEPASNAEAYNMLFQQTALYLRTYPHDTRDNEINAINTILNADAIADAYLPWITDPVKGGYHYGLIKTREKTDTLDHFRHRNTAGESEALSEYRKAWMSMFLRHPGTYVDAELAVIWPFFAPGRAYLLSVHMGWENTTATSPEYSFYHVTSIGRIWSTAMNYLAMMPLTDIIFGVFAYVWLALLLVLMLLRRKDWQGLGVFLPIALSLLFLCICPTASARYAYPVVIALPLLFAYIKAYSTNRQDSIESKS